MFKQLEEGQVVIDNKDGQTDYDTEPESRLQQLARRIDNLEYRNKRLLKTLDGFSVAYSAAYRAACNAVRFAEERGMEESFDHNVNSEKSYIEGVAQFYINLGYRFERLQKEGKQ